MANKTIDIQVKFTDHVGTETLVCQYEDANNYWVLEHVHGTGLQFRVVSGGSTIVTLGDGEVTDTNWHHAALCKVSDEYGLYLDGVQTAYVSDADIDTFAGVLRIGALSASNYLNGHVTEVRITNENDFGATPVVGLSDTITVPILPYSIDTGFTLICQTGALTLAGQNVSLIKRSILTCGSGSLTLAGQNATLLKGYPLICQTGALILAGQTIVFNPHKLVNKPYMSVSAARPEIIATSSKPYITATSSSPSITARSDI